MKDAHKECGELNWNTENEKIPSVSTQFSSHHQQAPNHKCNNFWPFRFTSHVSHIFVGFSQAHGHPSTIHRGKIVPPFSLSSILHAMQNTSNAYNSSSDKWENQLFLCELPPLSYQGLLLPIQNA